MLEADVLAVNGYTEADAAADPLFSGLDVVTEGRTVLLGSYSGAVSAALGYGSPLSLPFLLDEVVPALAAAADGDPATAVPAAPPDARRVPGAPLRPALPQVPASGRGGHRARHHQRLAVPDLVQAHRRDQVRGERRAAVGAEHARRRRCRCRQR